MVVSFKLCNSGRRFCPRPIRAEDSSAKKILRSTNSKENLTATRDSPKAHAIPKGGSYEAGDDVPGNSASSVSSFGIHGSAGNDVSFTLNLFSDGYSIIKFSENDASNVGTFTDASKLSRAYDRASEMFFSEIESGTLPCELADDIQCKYIDGTLVCEVRDYRATLNPAGIPLVKRICLRTSSQNVVKDISSISNDSWSYGDLMEVESRILKALQPKLSLDPAPMLDRLCSGSTFTKLNLDVRDMRRIKRAESAVAANDNNRATAITQEPVSENGDDTRIHGYPAASSMVIPSISTPLPHHKRADDDGAVLSGMSKRARVITQQLITPQMAMMLQQNHHHHHHHHHHHNITAVETQQRLQENQFARQNSFNNIGSVGHLPVLPSAIESGQWQVAAPPKPRRSGSFTRAQSVGSPASVGNITASSPIGSPPSADHNLLDRFSKLERVAKKHHLVKKPSSSSSSSSAAAAVFGKMKTRKYSLQKLMSAIASTGGDDGSRGGGVSAMSESTVGGSVNKHKIRIVSYVRREHVNPDSVAGGPSPRPRCRLIMSNKWNDRSVAFHCGDMELREFLLAEDLLPTLDSPNAADRFASQYSSLMLRDGYVMEDQVQPKPCGYGAGPAAAAAGDPAELVVVPPQNAARVGLHHQIDPRQLMQLQQQGRASPVMMTAAGVQVAANHLGSKLTPIQIQLLHQQHLQQQQQQQQQQPQQRKVVMGMGGLGGRMMPNLGQQRQGAMAAALLASNIRLSAAQGRGSSASAISLLRSGAGSRAAAAGMAPPKLMPGMEMYLTPQQMLHHQHILQCQMANSQLPPAQHDLAGRGIVSPQFSSGGPMSSPGPSPHSPQLSSQTHGSVGSITANSPNKCSNA